MISRMPTHFFVAWSVFCRMSHSRTLLKPFDRYTSAIQWDDALF